MARLIRFSVILIAVAGLAGCFAGRPIHYYTVIAPPRGGPSAAAFPVIVLVGHIGAPEILESQPIVYRSGKNEIGTYQYHLWAEPPAQMVKIMLIRRLRASDRFQSVAELGSSVEGDFVLQGRLYDFEEVDAGGVSALVSLELELINRKTHKTVWTHFYSHVDPVQGKQIPDVVSALDRNLEQGLTEVVASLDSYFSSNPMKNP